jgi:hypothetical protein
MLRKSRVEIRQMRFVVLDGEGWIVAEDDAIEGSVGLAHALESQGHLVSARSEPHEMSRVRHEVVQTRVEAESAPELEHVRAAARDVVLLENEHALAHSRQDRGAREAAHAAADHDGVDALGDLLDPIAVRADASEHVFAHGRASSRAHSSTPGMAPFVRGADPLRSVS